MILIATGSEVNYGESGGEKLTAEGHARCAWFPCPQRISLTRDEAYQRIGTAVQRRGTRGSGGRRYLITGANMCGTERAGVGMRGYGESAPAGSYLFGFTVERGGRR
ncbi:hypothetical protein [Enterobacter chuandaensis]|uniref:hypothetical protein n=1 Tax=Enterobacter chuandaensis TaxID=2497875 RepID=UPI003F68A8EF